MKDIFLFKSFYIGSFSRKCTSKHPHNFPRLVNNKRDETLISFWFGSSACLELGLYVGLQLMGSSPHMLQDLVL
jgi:hypothetical protein